MAIIKTPVVGVSPYDTTATTPIVLRADANGNTVLANPPVAAVAAAAAADTTATNTNSNVYVTGQEALNRLITTNSSGVFAGANVTINLEEQNFTTTNQVTSNTNYPSGNIGEIQYNSGSNSFASNAYFTYADSNIITPGIRTDGYFYSNGSPFTGGSSNYSNSNVSSFLAAFGSNVVLTTGNITGGNLTTTGTANVASLAVTGSVTVAGSIGVSSWITVSSYLSANGNILTGNNVSAAGNITGNYFIGNGSQLTNITSNYGNANVVANLAALGSNPVSSTGNITAGNITGGNLSAVNLVINSIRSDDSTFVTIEDGLNVTSGLISASESMSLTAGANTWAFNNNATTQFPANIIQAPAGSPITVRTTNGNSNSIFGAGDAYAQFGIQDDNTGAYQAWAYVETDMANVNTPSAVVILKPGNTGTEVRWNFDATGNLTLPGNIIAINYANGNRVTGNVTFKDEAVMGTGTSNTVSGLYLAPDPGSLANDLYLRVRGNINDEPTHIHFDTGNNQYYNQFIGDDLKYIQLANTGNIVINSNDAAGNTAQWNFDYNGVLTLPNADSSGFGNIYFEENSSTITFGLDDNAVPFLYSFATSGITLPRGGATIRDTAGNAVAFGRDAAATGPQGNAAVAIGQQAGDTSQGASSVAIGYQAGLNTQGANAVAIGREAGQTTQQVGAVAVGLDAGTYIQGQNAVAIGSRAGNTSQQTQSVAIGVDAAANSQGQNSVAIGSSAAAGNQGEKAVAIGLYAGNTTQGNSSVAIGDNAGYDTQGANSVAIGSYAGQSAQGNNSIIINATGAGLNALTANTFTVAPVRNDVANIAEIVFYNTTSKEITYGNTISVTGNITGNYFIGNGSQLTSVAVPGQTILPTIQTITAVARSAGLFSGGEGGANVTVANTISVTEYGVIITAGTISETYKTGALGSIPGTVSLTFTTGLNSTQYTLYAYVTSNAGTYYSNAVTGTSGICLLAETQIALSDGTHKAIEDITYTDKLLSWDFDRGCYAETTAMWIKRSETGSQYNLLTFSDGTTLRTFDQHRIFNKQAGAFTYPMTAATPIGTVTVNEHGQEITLTNKQVIENTIEYYNVITDYHMNLFSDSVLTSCRFNNIYPITDMKFAKDGRTPRTRAEFENVEDRFFHGLRLAEQTADIETVEWYVNRLLATEVSTQSELTF